MNASTTTEKLRGIISMLPEYPNQDKRQIRYLVKNRTNGRVLLIETTSHNNVEAPSTGISYFNSDVDTGVFLPNGEVMHASQPIYWRLTMAEYHGGWHLTILNHAGIPYDQPLEPFNLAGIVSDTSDPVLRKQLFLTVMTQFGCSGETTCLTLLDKGHALHMAGKISSRISLDGPSVAYVGNRG